MRLVHFTQRSYVNDRLVEAGERVLLPESIPLGAHMWDVSTGEHGSHPAGPRHTPVFLDHTGDAVQDSSSSGAFNPALAKKPDPVSPMPVFVQQVVASQDDDTGN